ncbi:Alpha/Beta hydrolase protein [Blyttiomyces helicus]|uniref:Alpha/Beta hydrolase protein n=1 Tax=Blyttiomyces helicus TaxID=388810 RepID=A0A4P9WDF1_9FUNG|nr:Alpha/Beta hydrolase protein [Blyttiomyces helicus]|eukprot:RKO89745.1 Alpha/Beta hydrolase protein [Blyttiomyces helicus]
MQFSSSLTLAASAILGVSGVISSPIDKRAVNVDSDTQTGTVPASAIPDLRAFASCAAAAYSDIPSITAWNCAHCDLNPHFRPLQSFQDPSNLEQVFIGADDARRMVIVSFRGTVKTISDWLDDFNALFKVTPSYLPTGSVSRGFSEVHDTVQSFVQQALPAAVEANPGYSVSFTVHLQGGVSATLAAADAFEYLNGTVSTSDIYLITVGCPRDGDANFASYMDQAGLGDVWRSANLGDTVPKVPPMGLGYAHVGESSVGPDLTALPVGKPQLYGPDGSGTVSTQMRTSPANFLPVNAVVAALHAGSPPVPDLEAMDRTHDVIALARDDAAREPLIVVIGDNEPAAAGSGLDPLRGVKTFFAFGGLLRSNEQNKWRLENRRTPPIHHTHPITPASLTATPEILVDLRTSGTTPETALNDPCFTPSARFFFAGLDAAPSAPRFTPGLLCVKGSAVGGPTPSARSIARLRATLAAPGMHRVEREIRGR